MASLGPLTIPCPACDKPITVTATLKLTGRTVDGRVEAVADLDQTAIRAHVEQHREEP